MFQTKLSTSSTWRWKNVWPCQRKIWDSSSLFWKELRILELMDTGPTVGSGNSLKATSLRCWEPLMTQTTRRTSSVLMRALWSFGESPTITKIGWPRRSPAQRATLTASHSTTFLEVIHSLGRPTPSMSPTSRTRSCSWVNLDVISIRHFTQRCFRFRSINNTQSARKINQAVNSTFSNAKTTFSSWLSNFSTKDELVKDSMDMETRDVIKEVEPEVKLA